MRHRNVTVICGWMFIAAAVLQAAERKIQRRDLPQAVQQTVDAQSSGATIKAFSTELEAGQRVYEAELLVDGHTRDLQIDANGTLQEIEEEVAFSSLSPQVQTALTRRTGSATIRKVESLTKRGKLVAYEAATLRGKIKGEIQVGPDGKRLNHAE